MAEKEKSRKISWYIYPLIILVVAFFYYLGSIVTAIPAMIISLIRSLFS